MAYLPQVFLSSFSILAFVSKIVNQKFVNEFGLNLRKIRIDKNISMQNLADNLNVEYSQISRIELGKINTSISMAYSIAEVLEIKVKDLFDF